MKVLLEHKCSAWASVCYCTCDCAHVHTKRFIDICLQRGLSCQHRGSTESLELISEESLKQPVESTKTRDTG